MDPLTPQDATMYWLSRRTRNDQFLLYCFAESSWSTRELRACVAARSRQIADLRVRLREDRRFFSGYPNWVDCDFDDEQFIAHTLPDNDWSHLSAALGELLDTGVEAAQYPWRLHIFRDVRGAPVDDRAVTVAVLQLSHALADGTRAARIARQLFAASGGNGASEQQGVVESRSTADRPRSAETEVQAGSRQVAWLCTARSVGRFVRGMCRTVWRGVHAYRAQRELAELTASGQVPEPGPGYRPGPLNRPERVGEHAVRVLVCPAMRFRVPKASVTVVALTAVSVALERYLGSGGEPGDELGAQVPMALSRSGAVRNNYRGIGVGLYRAEPDLRRRATMIADDLAARRTRARHALLGVQDSVTAALPAGVLRRDVERYPIQQIPEAIAGHTVVSSVDRGSADLWLGDAPVRFTAGFPALGSVMHLTHGIHGLGDTITVSVHADSRVMPDIDIYVDLLRAALDDVAVALGE